MLTWSLSLQDVFDKFQLPVFVTSQEGEILLCNRYITKIGKKRIVGLQINDVPEKIVGETGKQTILTNLKNKKQLTNLFFEGQHDRHIILTIFPYDENSSLVVLQDVTDAEKEKEKLQTEKSVFRNIFQSSPTPALIINSQGNIVHTNDNFTKLFNMNQSPDNMRINYKEIFYSEGKAPDNCPVNIAIANKKQFFGEISHPKTGRIINLNIFPLDSEEFVLFLEPLSDDRKVVTQSHGKGIRKLINMPDSYLLLLNIPGFSQILNQITHDEIFLFQTAFQNFLGDLKDALNILSISLTGNKLWISSEKTEDEAEQILRILMLTVYINLWLNPRLWEKEDFQIISPFETEIYYGFKELNKSQIGNKIITLSNILTDAYLDKNNSIISDKSNDINMLFSPSVRALDSIQQATNFPGSVSIPYDLMVLLQNSGKINDYYNFMSQFYFYKYVREKTKHYRSDTPISYNKSIKQMTILPVDPYLPQKIYMLLKRILNASFEINRKVYQIAALTEQTKYCFTSLQLISSQFEKDFSLSLKFFSFSKVKEVLKENVSSFKTELSLMEKMEELNLIESVIASGTGQGGFTANIIKEWRDEYLKDWKRIISELNNE